MSDGVLYLLCYGEDVPFYVGRTRQTLQTRLKGHKRDARNPLCAKAASEFARQQGIVEEFYIVEVCKEGELTEADIVRTATLEGHVLLNATRGDSVVPKKRSKSVFSALNRQAAERLAATERRNRLHSEAQQLSKPEIVRQRVLGTITSAESFHALEWRSAPPELLPFGRPPKNPDTIDCQFLKYGDYNLFIAFKPGKWCYWVKCTRNNTADAYKVTWRTAPKGFTRLDALHRIVHDWPTFTFWPV